MSGRGAPLFSIVLPTHNSVATLAFAIQSALAQTLADFELLIAGDGAAPGTAEAVRLFDDERIVWMDLPKAPGIGYANRNRAIARARGRYVAYLADDDLWFADHLERVAEAFARTDAEFVYSRILEARVDLRMLPGVFNLGIPAHCESLVRGEMQIGMSTVVHTRECMNRYGYWNETLPRFGDLDLWKRIAGGGAFRRVAFLSEPTSIHFVARRHQTRAYMRQIRVSDRLDGGLLARVVPEALCLAVRDGELPQAAAWRWLAADGDRATEALRRAAVEYQDAIGWGSRGTMGRLALRVVWAVSGVLRRTAGALQSRQRTSDR